MSTIWLCDLRVGKTLSDRRQIRKSIGLALALLAMTPTPALARVSDDLVDGWLFHRMEGLEGAAAQLPASGWTSVKLPHTARIEDRAIATAWQGTAFYTRSLSLPLKASLLRNDGGNSGLEVENVGGGDAKTCDTELPDDELERV